VYAWETLIMYSQQDDRWFEPVNRHVPSAEFLEVYRALMPDGWTLRRRGLWYLADPPGEAFPAALPGQGWKLHVSVASDEGAAALRAAIPVLRDLAVHFKFLLDPWSLGMTNGKLISRGSSAKFITVYPVDLAEFRLVADRLTAALQAFGGPYVLGDRRCPGSTAVYYRYGGFVGTWRLRPDGVSDLHIEAPDGSRYPDIRHPFWSAPPWVDVDPFGLDAQQDPPDDDPDGGLDGGRFEVEAPLRFSNAGGVYKATDTANGRAVVLKEARPHVVHTVDRTRRVELTDLLTKEYEILTSLADVEQFVNPVKLFRQWEHLFLVEEHIDGRHLGQVSIGANPLYVGPFTGQAFAEYHGRMQKVFVQLADAIATAHRQGIVLADISFTNVMLDSEDRIHIIDLEGAVRLGVDRPTGLYTPGVSRPLASGSGPGPAGDYAALGALIFGTVGLNNAVVGFHPPALQRFLAELQLDVGVPEDMVALITDLTSAEPPEADVVSKRIAQLTVADPAAWPQLAPLGRPAAELLVGGRATRLRAKVAETVAGVVRYIRRTATPLREDRLFPADLGLFETNPVSVAFGASGVLLALHRLTGETPSELLAWLLERDLTAKKVPPGLYFGLAGVAWTLADLGEVDAGASLLRRTASHPLLWEQADVMHGCAGYGLAALRLWQLTDEQYFLDEAARVGARLAETAERDERGASWPGTDGRTALGYAYGASGVALFLLYLHLATGDAAVLRLGREALDFDLSHAEEVGDGLTSFRAFAESDVNVLRQYWERGSAGVMTTLVRYLAATGDEELAGWVDRLLPDVLRKYAVMPQMFHGLAGIGNAVLDVAEFTGRADLVAEAWRTAEGVLLFAIERPDGTAFPGEQDLRETCDFASGSAGVALFLDRLGRAGPGRRTNFNFVLDELLPPTAGPRT